MTTKEYQEILCETVQEKFAAQEVISEWTAFVGYQNQYSPRVDIAVGPFSIVAGQNQIHVYDGMVRNRNIRRLLKGFYDQHCENVRAELGNNFFLPSFDNMLRRNRNARCFLAIEIENKNSKKHIMGSVINAASLGRVGLGVPFTDSTFRTFIRIFNYLAFLRQVGKNTYDTTNFLIVTKDQMTDILN